jgi:hypothetical protein
MSDRIRQRAIQIHWKRAGAERTKGDWQDAEKEVVLRHLAGIEDNPENFRITAASSDSEGAWTVNALGDAVVVEETPAAGHPEGRCSMFPMHGTIDGPSIPPQYGPSMATAIRRSWRQKGVNHDDR